MPAKRRPKGEGSITKLPNGNLKMTITLGVGVDGKQKRRSVTAKTKAELMQRVAEIRIHSGLPTLHTESIYFKDVVELFFKDKEEVLAEGTLANYRIVDRAVFTPLYDYRVDKITPEIIDGVIDSLRKRDGSKLSAGSISHFKSKLAAVLNFAVAKNFISASPIRHTKRRKAPSKRVDTIFLPTEEQIKRLLKDAKEYDEKKRTDIIKLYPLFLLAVATGMSIGEILDIDTNNINVEKSTISIQTQLSRYGSGKPLKTKASRRVIFVQPDILAEVLRLNPPSEKTTKLWCQKGKQVRYESIKYRIYLFLKKCTYLPTDFTFHCFRHYHATQLLLKGINPQEVSKRLGHASIKITLDLYAHWMPEMDAQAANSIDNSYLI